MDGIVIAFALPKSDLRDRCVEKLGASLAAIRDFSPSQYLRIKQLLSGILVSGLPARAAFFPKSGLCVLDGEFVAAQSVPVDLVAMALLHEACHARLWQCGFRYEAGDRVRIERICLKSEWRFASTREASKQLLQDVESRLAVADSFHSLDARVEREIDSSSHSPLLRGALRVAHGITRRLRGTSER